MNTLSLTLNAGTTLFAELNGNAAGTGYDQVSVTGAVTLAGATLNLTLGGGYVPAFGDRLYLIVNDQADPITGEFAGLPDGSPVTVGGYTATISYTGDSAGGATGNDVVLHSFTPEPGAVLVVAAVPLGFVGWARLRSTSGC